MIGRREEELAELFRFGVAAVRNLPVMRIVVTGANGQLGSYLLKRLVSTGSHTVFPWSGSERGPYCGLELRPVDLTDQAATRSALRDANPDVIVHAAAKSSAEAVRRSPEAAWTVNVDATARLAEWCRDHDRRLVFTSTDMVFDGTRSWYREADAPAPILAYGRTKAAAEASVINVARGVVVRISLLFGQSLSGRSSFFDRVMARLKAGEPQAFFNDEFRTPLDYATAAHALIRIAETDRPGIIHLGGRERVSRFELMQQTARSLGVDPALVQSNRREDVALGEPRPADLSLDTTLLDSVLPDLARPTIEEALRRSGC
jgi:dTDP-4-dehydrorhamnose reductase